MKISWTTNALQKFENDLKVSFERGLISCPLHLSKGNEHQLLSIFEIIKEDDWVISTHRSHYHYLLKGGKPNVLLDEILGKPTGVCGGRGRSMHVFDRHLNFLTSAIVAGGCSIACGIALALKKEFPDDSKARPHVYCFIGDGAEDSGHFLEAVRFGIARKLPLTFIIEDNDLSIDSTKKERWHNWTPVQAGNVIRYEYKRSYPHVGVGHFVSF